MKVREAEALSEFAKLVSKMDLAWWQNHRKSYGVLNPHAGYRSASADPGCPAGCNIISMQFEFEGNRYRIVFRYDKDRNWAAHQEHGVGLRCAGPWKGQPALWCLDCNLQLSHLPKSDRKRLARCTLFVHSGGAWEFTASGIGRVNLKAGDQFSRKEGREAALADMLETFSRRCIADDALGDVLREQTTRQMKHFRIVAWGAYHNRKEAGPFRKEAGS